MWKTFFVSLLIRSSVISRWNAYGAPSGFSYKWFSQNSFLSSFEVNKSLHSLKFINLHAVKSAKRFTSNSEYLAWLLSYLFQPALYKVMAMTAPFIGLHWAHSWFAVAISGTMQVHYGLKQWGCLENIHMFLNNVQFLVELNCLLLANHLFLEVWDQVSLIFSYINKKCQGIYLVIRILVNLMKPFNLIGVGGCPTAEFPKSLPLENLLLNWFLLFPVNL